jgi:serine/threonine-protein kinase
MSAVAPPPNRRESRRETTVLGDRYSLTKRIAIGGMGEVWEARDGVLGRQVAVKILRDDLVDSPVFLERFRGEARHTAALAHPGIASVFDYGEDDVDHRHIAYLVMELVPGRPLSAVMAERGALPVGMALSLLAQAADALHAAHSQGVVHRDVKPGNLMMLDDGTLKVTDFGIARAANSAALTEVGQIIGTANYLSPEQAVGGQATPSSDVYSLGVIGYEMLVGKPPFVADNAPALAMAHVHQAVPAMPATVPAPVRALIGQALAKEPADRPADAREFATKLRRLHAEVPAAGVDDPTLAVDRPGLIAPTALMGAETASRTAIMPVDRVVRRNDDLGLSQEAYASRRQRRRFALVALGVVVIAAIIALSRVNAADIPQPTVGPSTTVVSATTVVAAPSTVAPTVRPAPTTVAPTPTTVPPAPPGHAKKDPKPKHKPNG